MGWVRKVFWEGEKVDFICAAKPSKTGPSKLCTRTVTSCELKAPTKLVSPTNPHTNYNLFLFLFLSLFFFFFFSSPIVGLNKLWGGEA